MAGTRLSTLRTLIPCPPRHRPYSADCNAPLPEGLCEALGLELGDFVSVGGGVSVGVVVVSAEYEADAVLVNDAVADADGVHVAVCV